MGRQRRLRAVPTESGELIFRAQVHAAVDGDAEALTWLYETYVGMVRSYFRACAIQEADDLTSEVFVSMIRSLSSFSGNERGFRTWLMTIAHRRKVDHFRRSRPDRTATATSPDVIELRAGIAPSAAEGAVLPDPRLPVGLQQLTADQREVLAMRFLADMSLLEIAAATNRKVGAIKSLQKRAVESLQRAVPDLRHPEAIR